MNDQPDPRPVEDRIRDALRARADTTTIAAVAPPSLRAPVRRPRRRLPVVAVGVVGFGAAAAAIVAAVVVTTRPDGDERERTVVAGPDATVSGGPSTTAGGDPETDGEDGSLLGPLPYLVIDLPGLEPTTAEAMSGSGAGAASDPGVDGWYLQQYDTTAGAGGPRLQVLSVPHLDADGPDDIGATYAGADTEAVTVQGQPARLRATDRFTGVWWPGGGEGGVLLTAWDVPADEVLAVADSLAARPAAADGDGAGWDAGHLPADLTLAVDGERGSDAADPWWTTSVQYRQAVDPGVSLSVSTGGAVAFADRTAPNAFDTYEPYEVGGRPAVLVEAAGDLGELRVLWRPTDTTIAEINAVGSSRDEMWALAVSVREVDEAMWRAALPEAAMDGDEQDAERARLAPGTPLPPGSSWDGFAASTAGLGGPETGDPILVQDIQFLFGMARYAVCAWEEEWLSAVGAGDDDRAAAAVAAWDDRGSWSLYEEVGERMAAAGSEVTAVDMLGSNVGNADVDAVRAGVEQRC